MMTGKMHRRWLLLLLQCCAAVCRMGAGLEVAPQNATAEPGGGVAFNCSASRGDGVRWLFATEPNSEMQDHIYSRGFTYPQWRARHKVTEPGAGFFTLVIEPIVPADAGFYTCMDVKDDSYYEARLVVAEGAATGPPEGGGRTRGLAVILAGVLPLGLLAAAGVVVVVHLVYPLAEITQRPPVTMHNLLGPRCPSKWTNILGPGL